MTARHYIQRLTVIPALLLTVGLALASGQTVITPDNNKYTPAQDVELGQGAAREARQQLPMLDDSRVRNYIAGIGKRLVNGIPAELRHPGFRYSFEVVNMQEINAFALPGGPMFLNRGMLQAAQNEAEIAGVMAHEIAHVALRHGTAQATKAQPFQIGAVAGQILGAIIGGTAGQVIATGSQFGLGTYFLRYGREYEREADLLGAQIMARVGYDPRHMANMFRTIEQQGSRMAPEWMSSHPNPGNRHEAIVAEAASLRIQGSPPSPGAFNTIQAHLRAMPPAYTAEQVAKGRGGRPNSPSASGDGTRMEAEPPSTRYQARTVGNFLRLDVPANWQEVPGHTAVAYAPTGGYHQTSRGGSFTHGLEIGLVRAESEDLQRATQALVEAFARTNPELRQEGSRRDTIDGRPALVTTLSNVSSVTGDTQVVTISTLQLRDGDLLYLVGVAPQREADRYAQAFARVLQSVRLSEPSRRLR